MIRDFIASCKQSGETPIVKLYQEFKRRPKTESVPKLHFLNMPLRAGIPMRQQGKRIYVALTI